MSRQKCVGLFIVLLCSGCGGGGEKKNVAAPNNPVNPSDGATPALEDQVRALIVVHNITPLSAPRPASSAKVRFGRALFFDKELSGNRDRSSATCQHPVLHMGDHLSVSFGTGGRGSRPARVIGPRREVSPRNSPELFTRGFVNWTTLFWDARVSGSSVVRFTTPAKELLPSGVESLLAAQAFFPVSPVDEMRGKASDLDVRGRPDELAALPESGAA